MSWIKLNFLRLKFRYNRLLQFLFLYRFPIVITYFHWFSSFFHIFTIRKVHNNTKNNSNILQHQIYPHLKKNQIKFVPNIILWHHAILQHIQTNKQTLPARVSERLLWTICLLWIAIIHSGNHCYYLFISHKRYTPSGNANMSIIKCPFHFAAHCAIIL